MEKLMEWHHIRESMPAPLRPVLVATRGAQWTEVKQAHFVPLVGGLTGQPNGYWQHPNGSATMLEHGEWWADRGDLPFEKETE